MLEDSRGEARFLLAERAEGRGDGGHPRWRVLDALAYPALAPDQGLVFGQCEREGVADGGLVAVVDAAQDAEWFDRVARAPGDSTRPPAAWSRSKRAASAA